MSKQQTFFPSARVTHTGIGARRGVGGGGAVRRGMGRREQENNMLDSISVAVLIINLIFIMTSSSDALMTYKTRETFMIRVKGKKKGKKKIRNRKKKAVYVARPSDRLAVVRNDVRHRRDPSRSSYKFFVLVLSFLLFFFSVSSIHVCVSILSVLLPIIL